MYDTLCLSGGSVNGICHVGALKYLQDNNFINISKIKNFIGTSIGSMICFLLYIDYEINELVDFISDFDISKLYDDINIDNLLENSGIIDGSKMLYMLSCFLENKNLNKNITFLELYNITKKKLSIVVTNYNKCNEEVMNYINSPDLSVILAVRMSISLPIVFSPIKYNNNYYIDGGILNNFPIKYCDNKTTLGILISYPVNKDFTNIIDFIHGLVNIPMQRSSKKDINPSDLNIIKVDNYVNGFNLELNKKERLQFILHGEKQAKIYLDNLTKNICSQIINDIINQL